MILMELAGKWQNGKGFKNNQNVLFNFDYNDRANHFLSGVIFQALYTSYKKDPKKFYDNTLFYHGKSDSIVDKMKFYYFASCILMNFFYGNGNIDFNLTKLITRNNSGDILNIFTFYPQIVTVIGQAYDYIIKNDIFRYYDSVDVSLIKSYEFFSFKSIIDILFYSTSQSLQEKLKEQKGSIIYDLMDIDPETMLYIVYSVQNDIRCSLFSYPSSTLIALKNDLVLYKNKYVFDI